MQCTITPPSVWRTERMLIFPSAGNFKLVCSEEGFVKNRLRVTCTNLINRIYPKSSGFGSTSGFIVPEVDAKAKTS
jgi:hypothetical protein